MDILASIHQNAIRKPEKVAVEDGTWSFTYSKLIHSVARLSRQLVKQGVAPGSRIAIFMENSSLYILSILAALEVDAIWMPMNHAFPDSELKKVVHNTTPKLVLCDEKLYSRVVNLFDEPGSIVRIELEFLNLRNGTKQEIFSESEDPPAPHERHTGQDKNAYIIHTSGSTGSPKGVLVSYKSLSNYAQATIRDLRFHEGTRTLSMTPYYFDAPLGSIFCTLAVGGSLFIYSGLKIPRIVAKTIVDLQITYIGTTPELFSIVLDSLDPEYDPRLRLEVVGVGGDVIQKPILRKFLERFPAVMVVNRYGPTETTCVSASYVIKPASLERPGDLPIGRPTDGVEFYLFDENLRLVKEVESRGELYIGGVQLMQGYFGDPTSTAEVLRSELVPGKVLYKTNDICSVDAEGNYVFHGRINGLVKRLGYRIYLSEIEAMIRDAPGVEDSVCATKEIAGETLIVAFVKTQDETLTGMRVRQYLTERAPSYYMPNHVTIVDKFAYTTVGKLDRSKMLESFLIERQADQVG